MFKWYKNHYLIILIHGIEMDCSQTVMKSSKLKRAWQAQNSSYTFVTLRKYLFLKNIQMILVSFWCIFNTNLKITSVCSTRTPHPVFAIDEIISTKFDQKILDFLLESFSGLLHFPWNTPYHVFPRFESFQFNVVGPITFAFNEWWPPW